MIWKSKYTERTFFLKSNRDFYDIGYNESTSNKQRTTKWLKNLNIRNVKNANVKYLDIKNTVQYVYVKVYIRVIKWIN